MSEIKEGEYIRTIWGMIRKVSVVKDTLIWCEEYYYNGKYSEGIVEFKDIKAHSKNIIDLIEVGDFVNGNLVLDIDVEDGMICLLMPFDEENQTNFNVVWNTKNFIKTIVTKELFNSVMYKVGDIE